MQGKKIKWLSVPKVNLASQSLLKGARSAEKHRLHLYTIVGGLCQSKKFMTYFKSFQHIFLLFMCIKKNENVKVHYSSQIEYTLCSPAKTLPILHIHYFAYKMIVHIRLYVFMAETKKDPNDSYNAWMFCFENNDTSVLQFHPTLFLFWGLTCICLSVKVNEGTLL